MSIHEELEIRSTHPYGFRSGEWAAFAGTQFYYVESIDTYRWCYQVVFPDGVVDYWNIDPNNGWTYEIRRADDYRD